MKIALFEKIAEVLRNPAFQNVLQIARYGISGISGGVVQVASLHLFVDLFGIWYLHGVILAFAVSLVFTFLLQKYWTFADYSTNKLRRQSAMYFTVAIVALILNVAFMYLLVDIYGVWHLAAQIIVVFCVGVLTFLVNRMFTFENGKTPDIARVRDAEDR